MRSLDFPANKEEGQTVTYVQLIKAKMVLWWTPKAHIYCKKRTSVLKICYFLSTCSFAIECAILQMLFAVCKNLQGESVVCEEKAKLYESSKTGRFLTKKKRKERKKIELFQWLYVLLSKCFLSLFISFFSVVMRRSRKKKKERKKTIMPNGEVLFFSFSHKEIYTNMWVVVRVRSEWGR